MTTLKELLDSLEIDTKDIEEKKEEKEFKLDDLPEEHRPFFKKLQDDNEKLKNEIATRDLAIKTIKESFPRREEKPVEEKKEKILGVLDPEDQYAPVFKSLADEIRSLKEEKKVNSEREYEQNVLSFAREHKDIVRYATAMDALAEAHPTLKMDIPRLYTLAKTETERRESKSKDKVAELDRQRDAKKYQTESSGTATSRVSDASKAKDIASAFEMAEKNLTSNRR